VVEVREILRDLIEDSHRASEVIRKIRALVKKGELEATPLSIASVIRDVALLVHSDAIVRGIRVRVAVTPELPPVHGDKVQLQQVVLNLLLNAFDALESCPALNREVAIEVTPEGGQHTCRGTRRWHGSHRQHIGQTVPAVLYL
jgi:two-component system, LuxR family, sensor kinase FixL